MYTDVAVYILAYNAVVRAATYPQKTFRKNCYDCHRKLLLFLDEHVGGKSIAQVLNRKDLESYLSFSPMSQLRKHSAYLNLALKFRTKLLLRKNFGKTYHALKQIKVTIHSNS